MIVLEPQAAEWVGGQLDTNFVPPFISASIYGLNNDLIGGMVFNDYNGSNIEITAAGNGAFTKDVAAWVAGYVFNQLGCARMTTRTRPSNQPAIYSALRHGFKMEGYQSDYYADGQDAIIFGLKKSNLPKWLKKAIENELS